MNLTVSMLLPFCIVLLWKLHLYKKNISTIKEMFNALWQQGFVLRYVPQQSGNFVLMLKISSYVVYQDLIINLLSQFTIFVDLIDSIWFGLLLQKFQVLGDSAGSMLGRDMENLIQRARKYKKEFEDSYVSVEHLLLGFAEDNRFGKQLYKDFKISEKTLRDAIQSVRGRQRVIDQGINFPFFAYTVIFYYLFCGLPQFSLVLATE